MFSRIYNMKKQLIRNFISFLTGVTIMATHSIIKTIIYMVIVFIVIKLSMHIGKRYALGSMFYKHMKEGVDDEC